MTKRKVIALISIISLLMIVVLGCGNQPATNTSGGEQPSGTENSGNGAQKVLKIGVVAPLSGAGAAWGLPLKYGVEIAAEKVNEEGGLEIDGQKYKVEVIAYDDKYTGDGAATATNRLISEDKVKFIFGTIGSAGVLAMQELTEKNGVLLLTNSYGSNALSPEKPLSFRMVTTVLEWGKYTIQWMKEKYPDAKKVAFISPNDESGWEVQKHVEKDFLALGYEIVAKEFPERGTEDYNPVLTKVIAKNPDIIAFGGTPPGEMGVALKQAKALGYEGLFVNFGGTAFKEIKKVAGDAMNGFIYNTRVDFESLEVNQFWEKYGDKYEQEYLETAPGWSDAVFMLFEAMKKANSLEPQKVAEQLRAIKSFKGILGTMTWTGNEDYGIEQQILLSPILVAQVQNGEQVIVARINVE